MAFSQPVWEVQTGGDDTNSGGGFDVNSTFPTDGAATSATGTAPVFTSASYNFVAGDVGHWIFIKSGTNWLPGWYKIASVAANAATLNAAIGAGVVYLLSRGQIQGPSLIAGCATVASPSGATWGIDYSQKGSPYISFTDMVIGGTTTQFTSALNPVGKNFVGNLISVTSGVNFTVQRVRVVSTSGTTATCDKSLGTAAATGGNGGLGGAFKSPALPFSIQVNNNDGIYVKSGSYTISSASTNVANGVISSSGNIRLEGYGTVRGDLGAAPVLTASGINTVTICSLTGTVICRNLTIDGASLVSTQCFSFTGSALLGYLTAKNATNSGFNLTNSGVVCYRCAATGCATAGAGFTITGGRFFGCESYGNSVSGFSSTTTSTTYIECIASGNSGGSSDGFTLNATNTDTCIFCTAYGNGRDGFRGSGSPVAFINCIAEANSGFGFNASAATSNCLFDHCATFNNTSGATNNPAGVNTANMGVSFDTFITGTSTFFTNAGSGDFSLNNTTTGGGLLRGKGWPGVFPRGTSTGYSDIGAVQSGSGNPNNPSFTGFVLGG